MIGRMVPREFRLHDNNARPCDITVREIFIARQGGDQVKKFIILTFEEIETIISQGTPSMTKRAAV